MQLSARFGEGTPHPSTCFPCRTRFRQLRSFDRPKPEEISQCRPFLQAQIRAVAPELIVGLGRYAAYTLLDVRGSIARIRGRFYDLEGIAVRPTYHPSALLRNAALKRPVWEDMKAVRERLARPQHEAPSTDGRPRDER